MKVRDALHSLKVLEPGYKYNLTDFAAAMGIIQLKKIDTMIARRKHLAKMYLHELSQIEGIIPLELPDYEMQHAWHLFIVRVDEEKNWHQQRPVHA